MKHHNPNPFTKELLSLLASDCQETDRSAQRGIEFLQRCGSCHGTHDLSPDELTEIIRRADTEKLMGSPNLLKWWNVLR